MSRRPQLNIQPTLLDKAIGYLSPAAGQRRLRAKVGMALASSYIGAAKGRRATQEWNVSKGDADADLLNDLPALRERSRDLVRNNPIARGAINTKVTGVVGSGLRLQAHVDRDVLGLDEAQANALNKQIEREFSLWGGSTDCDLERSCTFVDLQDLSFRQVLENGDVVALMPMRQRSGPYQTCIQLIEADRVSNPDHGTDTDKLRAGIELDGDGAPVQCHIADQHPGAYGRFAKGTKWQPVPFFGATSGRRQVHHLFRKLRPGQNRGVPDLAPVIEPLKQLDRYTEAELMAAVVSGMFTVFIKTQSGETGLDAPMQPTAEIGGSSTDKDYKLGSGAMVELLPDEEISTANPGRPNDKFDPFVQAVLGQVAVGLDLPVEVLMKHFKSSYSAARAALLDAWKFFRGRRGWLARHFCQPIYESWFEEAVLRGRIAAPGFVSGDAGIRRAYLSAEWIGDSPGQIDESKEVAAAAARIRAGLSNKKRETAYLTGNDWEAVNEQRRKEQAIEVMEQESTA